MDENASILYKKKLIEALKAFDEFCNANDLNYYACSGTAIGAVRHKGFIPWDDDIDIYMLRADYNRLIELRSKLNGGHYRIAELGDEGYVYAFAKFYDSNTTLVEYSCYPTCRIGVYIDIFALDEVEDDEDLRQKKIEYERLSTRFQKTFFSPSWNWIRGNLLRMRFKDIWETLSLCYCRKSKKTSIRNKFIEYEMKWRNDRGDFLFFHKSLYKIDKEIFRKEWFKSYVYLPFEDYRIRVNKEYDKYLTHLFGDYMTPPPVEQQKSHHYHYYLNLKESLTLEEVKRRIKRGERTVL